MRMQALVAFLVVLIGCSVNGSGSGSDSSGGGGTVCPQFVVLLRDPFSGVCHDVAACDIHGNPNPDLNQAACQGSCDSFAEADCINVAGCQPAYVIEQQPGGGSTSHFYGCWNIAPSGPVDTRACSGLDAQFCSRRDTCSPWYIETTGGTPQFDHCIEKG